MIGTISAITAAAGIASSIVKSRQARKAQQEQQAQINRLGAQNDAYYNRYFHADATQLADNRALLTEASERLRRQNQAAAGTAAVMGGTNAQAAATKEANNQAYADAVRGVAANAQSYKTHVQDQYRTQEQNLANANNQLIANRAASNAAAIDTAMENVNTMASSYIANNTKKP